MQFFVIELAVLYITPSIDRAEITDAAIIDDVFLVSLFKVLSEHPNMTATQVIELVNEKGMLVAPTLGRQHTEDLRLHLCLRFS